MLTISPCRRPSDRHLFERIPEILHGHDRNFVPVFPGTVTKLLKYDSLFQRQDGTIYGFIARRNGRPVGRLAAIWNRSHNKYWNDQVGFFGFFACEDNEETAQTLFRHAEDALRKVNCTSIRGPYNPSINEECGLLMEGHDEPPNISMPWNPPYYAKLLESVSQQVTRTLYGFHLPLDIGIPSRVQKIADRLKARSQSVRIRSFDMSRLDKELELAHRLYNVTLDRNWGFVPISFEDLLASADDLKAFADPDFLIFAEVDGEAVGFMLTLPNFNEILIRTKRVPRLLRLPWILLLMKTHRIQSVRQVVLGVAPEHRDHGLAALMCNEMVLRTQKTAKWAELSWIEANNTHVIRLIELMGARRSRTYTIWEKPIDQHPPARSARVRSKA